jgi:hypothetical protein
LVRSPLKNMENNKAYAEREMKGCLEIH